MKINYILIIIFTCFANSQNWENVDKLNALHITDIEILEDGIGILTTGSLNQQAEPSGIFRTTDFGESWSSQPYFLQSYFNTFAIESYNNNLYLSTSSNGIFISREKGEDFYTRIWQFDGNFRNFDNVHVFDDELYVTDYDLICRTVNNSDTNFTENLFDNYSANTDKSVISIYKNNNDLFVVTSKSGIVRSSDDGNTWANASNGLIDSNITYINGNKNGDLFVSITDKGLFKSTNNGDNWGLVDGTDEFFINGSQCNKILIKGDSIYLGMWDGIYLAEDSNLNFSNILTDFTSGISTLEYFYGKLYYAPYFGNLHILENGQDKEIEISESKAEISAIDGDELTIFYGTKLGTIIRESKLTGKTEEIKSFDVYSKQSEILEILYDDKFLLATDSSGKLLYSFDLGNTFSEFQADGAITDLSYNNDSLFAIIDSLVYFGSFADEKFTKLSADLDSYKALDIVANENKLYIATDENGILDFDLTKKEINNINNLSNKKIEEIKLIGDEGLVYIEKTGFTTTDIGSYINNKYLPFTLPSNAPNSPISTINANNDNIICGLKFTQGGHLISNDGGQNFSFSYIDTPEGKGGITATSSLITDSYYYLVWTGSVKRFMKKEINTSSVNTFENIEIDVKLEGNKLIVDNKTQIKEFKLSVFGINGKEFYSENLKLNSGLNYINVELPNGFIFVNLIDKNSNSRQFTKKMIK